jgi:uncharacterized protein (TIGR03435 family)
MAAPAKTAAPAKPLAFDVVSIRQDVAGGIHDDFGPTADGYRIVNKPLVLAIVTAYVPQSSDTALFAPDSIRGLPEWVQSEHYDIAAKVSEADLPQWQKAALQPAMLRAMLQAMLADRFKLAVHREMKEVQVYSLMVGKSGPKFKATDPAEAHPGARVIPGGAAIAPENQGHSMHLYNASMATLGSMLSSMAARPVVDNTGLNGRYDFVLQKPEASAVTAGPQEATEPAPTIFSVVEALGLKLVSAKSSVETLVIDHVERPSEN